MSDSDIVMLIGYCFGFVAGIVATIFWRKL